MKTAPFCFIVCGPSGVGKTTLVNALRDQHGHEFSVSVSYTTRKPRGAEENGVHYHFVDMSTFEQMIADQKFAEWADVHGNKYGTAKAQIEAAWNYGKNVLFDIDYQGANQLKETFGPRAISVLVVPPSMSELEARLRGRETDDEETIHRRLAAARHEIAQVDSFDFVLQNNELEAAQTALKAIYVGAKHSRELSSDAVKQMLAVKES